MKKILALLIITAQRRIAEAEYVEYGGCVGQMYVELLQMLQQFQNKTGS